MFESLAELMLSFSFKSNSHGMQMTTKVLTFLQVYLVVGYIMTTSVEVYDVVWTMPHSIHTMKLIGTL